MEIPQPGLIVSVPGMEGMYLVLAVDLTDGLVVLLSRDGRKLIVRGVAIQSVQIARVQMVALIDRIQTSRTEVGG